MKKYSLILLLILMLFQLTCCQNQKSVDPTGTYILNDSIDRDSIPIKSYFGDIQVLRIAEDEIVMTFFICKGAPSYNSGSFRDTLNYKNNRAECSYYFQLNSK